MSNRIKEMTPSLVALFKNKEWVAAYRQWATDPRTARVLSLAADIVSPPPSTVLVRASHAEAVSALTRKETAEEFMQACLSLEEYAMLTGDNGLPPADYGASEAVGAPEPARKVDPPPPAKKPSKKKKPTTAKPAKA